MNRIKILIVDDHAMFREGIKALLEPHSDFEIVGEASNGEEAIQKTRELNPQVILMDIGMAGSDGLMATWKIKADFPQVAILALTIHDTEEYFFEILKAGASGYVLKEAPSSELFTAIKDVAEGKAHICSVMARKLLDDYLRRVKSGEEKKSYEVLSNREKEVVRLIGEGFTHQEIAQKLSIAISTMQTYRNRVMEKLKLHNRSQLILYALQHGLIDTTT